MVPSADKIVIKFVHFGNQNFHNILFTLILTFILKDILTIAL